MGCCGSKARRSLDLDEFSYTKSKEKNKYALSSGKQGSYQSLDKMAEAPPPDQLESVDKSGYELSLPHRETGLPDADGRAGSVSSLDELLGKNTKASKKTNKTKNGTQSLLRETLEFSQHQKTKNAGNGKPENFKPKNDEKPLAGSHMGIHTLEYEPRRLHGGKPLVEDKWKSEPLLCEPRKNKLKTDADKKLGSVPDVAVGPTVQAVSGTTTEHAPKAHEKPRNSAELRVRVLMGYFNVEIPNIAKLVRVYMSSTLTDSQVERNALIERVYPKLKEYCQEHGYEFQVIDMRWGVKETGTDDHVLDELCIRELQTCREISIGPNFVTLLGQKYGSSLLPTKIPISEFDAVLGAIEDADDKDLIGQWFQRDENAVPPQYVLQPISSKFPGFVNSQNKEDKKAAVKDWGKVFLSIQNALKTAAAKALSKEDAQRYHISVNEREIEHGILSAPNANSEALWFKRTITDLKENLKSDKSDKFIDIKETKKLKGATTTIPVREVDKAAQSQLKSLKDKKISKTLDKSNIFPYNIKWASDRSQRDTSLTHSEFLGKLCQDFFLVMKRRISDGIKNRATNEFGEKDKENLVVEVSQHVSLCQRKSEDFHGRDDILTKVRDYLTNTCSSPLVIHGSSGFGKSSLVAMAAKNARSWVNREAVVVVRFLGTTPDSSNLRLSLRGVCIQLCRAFAGNPKLVPQDFLELVREFQDRLSMAKSNRPIIVFLDSLEQLDTADNAHQMAWLPRILPSHVHVVVSTLNDSRYKCLSALQKLILDSSSFINIESFSREDATTTLSSWLKHDNRQLTDAQRTSVLDGLTACPSPLYLKLAYAQAVNWKSYTPAVPLETTVSALITALFDQLEQKHGHVLTERMVSYLTVARYGLSELELEDILSCDEDVLCEVFHHWAPPIRRIPTMLVARVRADLEPYLLERCTNGVRVFTWYYRQFVEAATQKYLEKPSQVKKVHADIADYFYGRWTQGAKKDDGKGVLKDRHVASQPFVFSKDVFNLRKLNELPHHLMKSGDVEKLKQHTICNYEFLSAKLQATSPRRVLQDFTDALATFPTDKDIAMVFETMQLSRDALTISADQLSAQLIGRLSSPRSPTPVIARLLRQAHHPVNYSFIPNIACLNRPGGKLVHSLPDLHAALVLSGDSSKALSVSRGKIILWDVQSGSVLQTIESPSDVGQVLFCLEDKHVIASCKGAIRQWFLKSAKLKYEIESTQCAAPIATAQNGNTVVAIMGKTIKVLKASDGSEIKAFQDGDFTHDQVTGLGDLVALANSADRYVNVYDLENQTTLKTIQVFEANSQNVVTTVTLSPFNDGQVVVYSHRSSILRVFDIKSANCLHVLGPDILYPALTLDGRYMLCTNCYNDVSVWNLETAMKERSVVRHLPSTAIRHITSHNMKLIVTVSDDELVRVWDLEREEVSNVDFEDNKGDHCIEYLAMIKSTIQKQVVTKSRASGPISVWNVITCQPIRTLVGTNADEILVVDETRAVVRSGAKLALVDLQEGKLIKKMRSEFTTKTDKVNRHASSLYKRRDLAIRLAESPRFNTRTKSKTRKFNDCALVGSAHVLVLSKDRLYMKLASLETGEPVAKLKAGQRAIIETIMVCENGTIAVCACENSSLLVWNIRERRNTFSLDMDGVFPRLATADITHNGHYLVDVIKLDKKHKTVVTWDLETGTVKHLIGQGVNVWSVAVSSVSMRLVVTGSSGSGETIRIYDLENGEFKHQLGGHTEPVKGVCLSKDGRRLLTYVPLGSRDRSVCVWDIMSGCPIASFTPDLPVSSCVLNDDSDQVVMVINKSRPIVSLALTHEVGSREMSVDVSNSYFNHPTLHGAVFDMSSQMDWDDADKDDNDAD